MALPPDVPDSRPLTRPPHRPSTVPTDICNSFLLGLTSESYKHQYANLYFVRLKKLQAFVQQQAVEKWSKVTGNPEYVSKVLEVVKGKVCWIIGTVYIDMPLKDNVLKDLAKDHFITAPPARTKFYSETDQILLEDESGRIRLSGDKISAIPLVSGVVMGALGVETNSGDFEVLDVCYAGPAPQEPTVERPTKDNMDFDGTSEWIALVSGLNIGPPNAAADLRITLLVEYLLSEAGSRPDQQSASSIARLILAGDSFAPLTRHDPDEADGLRTTEVSSKFEHQRNQDDVAFTAHPTQSLAGHIAELARVMNVHLVPGAADPAGATLPQQPMPRAMFGEVKTSEGFLTETNPCWLETEGCDILGTGGQTLDDIYKYVKTTDRLAMACETLQWRHMAPTAPDTLWCYPYFKNDPFIITRTPHLYFIGNQPRFESTLLTHKDGQKTRVVLVPRFSETGQVVLVNPRNLDIRVVSIGTGWEESR